MLHEQDDLEALIKSVGEARGQTIGGLRANVRRIDAIITALEAHLVALERAYVRGSNEISAGCPATRDRLAEGRFLLETAREARDQFLDGAAKIAGAGAGLVDGPLRPEAILCCVDRARCVCGVASA